MQKVAAQAAGRWKLGTRGEGRRRRHHQWGSSDEETVFGGQRQQTDGRENIVSTGARCPPPRFTRCSKHTWGEGRGAGNLGKRSALPGSAASHKSPPTPGRHRATAGGKPLPSTIHLPSKKGKSRAGAGAHPHALGTLICTQRSSRSRSRVHTQTLEAPQSCQAPAPSPRWRPQLPPGVSVPLQ